MRRVGRSAVLACAALAAVQAAAKPDLFVGTQGLGHVSPAAAWPFGMVQAGPDTSKSADRYYGDWAHTCGYQHDDPYLWRFSQCRFYGIGDSGQMAAWYVFSAMGFYPVDPCGGEYVVGAPQVPEARIRLGEWGMGNGEREFCIVARNLSRENKYVKSVTLNGTPVTDWRIRHADIMAGGELVFEMSDRVETEARRAYVRDMAPHGADPDAIPLNDGWTVDGEPVTLPHCWNVEDGTDGPTDPECWNHDSVGGTGYGRKKAVYAREIPDARSGKRRYLRVHAASIHAVVRMNGREIGRHSGAFTAFTLELPSEGGRLEIEVDNFFDPDVPPVCGDFTMYGGLYRGVYLVEADSSRRFVAEDGLFEDELAAPQDLPRYEFREDGFYVDGRKTFLKGVCCHQDREGKGWAISADDEEGDVRLVKEMGANAIRTSHYPRSERFYDLCDKYGLYVWTELPLVDATTDSAAFRSNTLAMAREMVLQHRRHKCIAMWGLFNELYLKEMPDGQAEPLVREVKELIRSLDPRPVVAASNNPEKKELNSIPDALGFNMYPGWYGGDASDLGPKIEEWRLANGRDCVAVSEFGAGGSLGQDSQDEGVRPEPGGKFHPLSYQLRHHKLSWGAIKDSPHVWGAFVWVMFDCGSDSRHEGARDGLNDKGLVGFDHKTKKPAYDFYQGEWR